MTNEDFEAAVQALRDAGFEITAPPEPEPEPDVPVVYEPPVDLRPRVTTTKAINICQLREELGTPIAGTDRHDVEGEPSDIVVADESSPVTQEELEAAIDAHEAVWPVATAADKFAALGITRDDLKVMLG